MKVPSNITELCQGYLGARASVEAERSGNLDASGFRMRELRLHLQATFGVALEPCTLEPEDKPIKAGDEVYPCPGCKFEGAVIESQFGPTITVFCRTDCGRYLFDRAEWDRFQDEYDPTPEVAPCA